MRTIQRTILFAALMLCMSAPMTANAFFYRYGEHVARVQKLPDTPEYTMSVGGKSVHVDIGVFHKQLAICGIPVWNHGKKEYALYHSSFFGRTSYSKIDAEVANAIGEELGFRLPEEPRLPFWHRWIPRIIWTPIFLYFAYMALNELADKFGWKKRLAALFGRRPSSPLPASSDNAASAPPAQASSEDSSSPPPAS